MKQLDVAIAVVFHASKILITRRKPDSVLGGLWEFPGGKCEPGESPEVCVRRELLEELAIGVKPVVCFPLISHQYPDRLVRLYPFLCTYESGTPQPIACDELRWVEPIDLRSFKFPPANQALIEQVIAALPRDRLPTKAKTSAGRKSPQFISP